jgi:hypothetical protein
MVKTKRAVAARPARPSTWPKDYPGYIRMDQRICFAIAWFDSAEHAQAFHEAVLASGRTYNGGMFHGMACGRDRSWDTRNEQHEVVQFAVTF